MTKSVRVRRNTIDNSLKKIKATIRTAPPLSREKKEELLLLLSGLESGIVELHKSESEHAESIMALLERSAAEAVRKDKDAEQMRLSLEGLAGSVKKFELSHPRLVEEVNGICTMLANMGI